MSVRVALLLSCLLTAQAAVAARPSNDPAVPSVLACRLMTSSGAPIAIRLETKYVRGVPRVAIAPTRGSPWPAAPTAFLEATPATVGPTGLTVSNAPQSLILEIRQQLFSSDSWLKAVLFHRDKDEPGLPAAFGFCDPGTSGDVVAAAGPPSETATAELFDPARWPDHCTVLAHDGRISRLKYASEMSSGALEPLDDSIWKGGKITVPRKLPQAPPPLKPLRIQMGHAFFGGFGSGPPSGSERFYFDAPSGLAMLLLEFDDMGSKAPSEKDPGWAMCGFRNVGRPRPHEGTSR